MLFLDNRDDYTGLGSDKTCFIAHAAKNRDLGDGLVEEFKVEGITCFSPFLDKAQISFLQMVLEFARSTSLFLVDLSYPNLNVIFELGLVNGLGLPNIMIKDSTIIDNGVPPLLKDIK